MLLLFGAALAEEPTTPAEPAPPASAECFPPCSPGYLCHAGQCIEACNPPCAASERCTAERVCEARELVSPAVPDPAAGEGEICVLRDRKFAASALKFHVAVDDDRVAVLPNGSYACFNVAAGPHQLDLSTPTAGVGRQLVRITIDVEVGPGSKAYYQGSIGDGIYSPAMYLVPLDEPAAEGMKQKLRIGNPG